MWCVRNYLVYGLVYLGMHHSTKNVLYTIIILLGITTDDVFNDDPVFLFDRLLCLSNYFKMTPVFSFIT